MKENTSLKTTLNIVAIALVAFSGIMAETAMNVTFPALSHEFHTNLNAIQWVTTAYLLAVTIMITTSSYLIKRYSSRHLWLASIVFFVIGTLICGLSSNLTFLILGRVLEGIAAGIAMPLVFNIVVATVPAAKIGAWMGIASMIISLAPSFGPTYGGALADTFGWRSIFFILLIAPTISLILGWKTVFAIERHEVQGSFDVLAFLSLAIFLTSSLLLVNKLESGKVDWSWLMIAVITLILFVLRGTTSKANFINLKLFTHPKFIALLIPIAVYMFILLGLNLIIPTYLQYFLHVSSFWAGFSLLPGALIGALLAPMFGRLYDLKGAKLPLYLGNAIFTVIIIMMTLWIPRLSLPLIITLYILFIIGRNMAYTSAQTAVIVDEDPLEKADAMAIVQTLQMFMGALGTTVGALLQAKYGAVNGLQHFSWLSVVLAILIFGLFAVYFSRKLQVKRV
ncbi:MULTISPECIES: MFS transporter [Leuconostoc]|uniref:Transporter n=2 Tax=Leuconostoc kimchii TaxID=136609 RepID=D5T3A3_LEUKI|nr:MULTISPECIES: MFS transporter [Leuconostoc]ADG40752.1 transporter [Leuconostoc kimchii IMSNU 11154]AEJ31273.1 transporter [Leuconostoc sp. C2]QBR48355.1 MFS transporter [Leuconostoc kimchii]